MMRKILVVPVLIAALCCPAAAAQPSPELVEKAIELSGVTSALDSFTGQLEAIAQQRRLVAEHPDVEDRVYQALRDSYDVARAKEQLFGYLLENADPVTLKEAVAMMETPLVRRITAEEVAATAGQSNGDLLRYLGDLQTMPPSQERIVLSRQLVEEAHMSETAVDLALALFAGMEESMSQALPEEKQQDIVDVEGMIEQMRPAMEKALEQQMIYGSFYTYRNISDADLRAYVDFLGSEVGQDFSALISGGLVDVFAESFSGAAGQIAELARQARNEKCAEGESE